MDTAKKILLIALGLVLVIAVLVIATWLGSLIRSKYLVSKPLVNMPLIETNPAPQESLLEPDKTSSVPGATTIPQTGPQDLGYLIMGLLLVTGVTTLRRANRFS